MNTFLAIRVLDGPAPFLLNTVALLLAIYLLVRRPGRGRVVMSSIGVLIGALAASAAFVISNATHAFGEQLDIQILWWATAAFCAAGLAVANLWRSRWWRKAVALLSLPVFIAAGVIGVNGLYGLNATVGEVVGVSQSDPITIPGAGGVGDGSRPWAPTDGALYQWWKAPAHMPAIGREGTVAIPATLSGFKARPAGLYLPPAALVSDPPVLPIVILMMGFPGHPGPEMISALMDAYQKKHEGLAPIVLIADQIGTQGDPACADSRLYGKAQTYVTKDVVNWAHAHLHVIQDPKYWAIMGFSNGGGCAIKYSSLMPETFPNIVDISGEPFPGSEDPGSVLRTIFEGNTVEYNASKPMNIMRKAPPGTYNGVNAVFTFGAQDPVYRTEQTMVSSVARSVGMNVTLVAIPDAGHAGTAFTGGVAAGLDVLYPLWGLSAP